MIKDNKIVCAIDPGSYISGFSILEYKNKKIKVIEVGELKRADVVRKYLKDDKNKYSNFNIAVYLAYEKAFKDIFNRYKYLDAVIIESAFNKRFLLAYLALSTLKLFIQKSLDESKHELKLIELAPRNIKKHICGNGGADKDDMKKALLKYKGLIKKGLKIKDYSEHMIDAIAVGITYLENKKE